MKKSAPFKVTMSAHQREVTGSSIPITIEFPDGNTRKILVDCGYFQEIKYQYQNYVDDINPQEIDAVIITHNHIDHTGLLPKLVRNGYTGPIYMTEITRELCPEFLYDVCSHQSTLELSKRYPDEASMFKTLYSEEDVDATLKQIIALPYLSTLEILPGIKLTYFENGHLLGAGMVLLQCSYPHMQDINLFFTGDYRARNPLYPVPALPKWVKNLPIILVNESTYGATDSVDIKKCFRNNVLTSFSKGEDIFCGAFSQGRLQELLYEFKLMDDEGLIPPEYTIDVVGPLGVSTTLKYQKILSWYNPSKADFMPKRAAFQSPGSIPAIIAQKNPKIVLATSGMLSNGPARSLVPYFLQNPKAMIHLVGYAAEGTLARALLDAKREESVTFNSKVLTKRAIVKTTREFSAHATADEMLEFIRQFKNVVFVGINHGEITSQKAFQGRVKDETGIKRVELLSPDYEYVFYQNTPSGARYTDMLIKKNTPEVSKSSKSSKKTSKDSSLKRLHHKTVKL